jgi:hypothetical protein
MGEDGSLISLAFLHLSLYCNNCRPKDYKVSLYNLALHQQFILLKESNIEAGSYSVVTISV